jgi:hypothetical protein
MCCVTPDGLPGRLRWRTIDLLFEWSRLSPSSNNPLQAPSHPTEHYFASRRYQEDSYTVASVSLPTSALRWNVLDDRLGAGWTPQMLEGFEGEEPKEEGEERKRQVAYFGVFDGCVLLLFVLLPLLPSDLFVDRLHPDAFLRAAMVAPRHPNTSRPLSPPSSSALDPLKSPKSSTNTAPLAATSSDIEEERFIDSDGKNRRRRRPGRGIRGEWEWMRWRFWRSCRFVFARLLSTSFPSALTTSFS